jgi:hypothetical protein
MWVAGALVVPLGCNRYDVAATVSKGPTIYEESVTVPMNGWTCVVSGRGDSPLAWSTDQRRDELLLRFSGHTIHVTERKVWVNGETWNLPRDLRKVEVLIDMDKATVKAEGYVVAGPVRRPRSEAHEIKPPKPT